MRYGAVDLAGYAALVGGAGSRSEDRIVTANIADDFRPAAAIKCQCDPLRGTNSRFDNQQVGPRFIYFTQ